MEIGSAEEPDKSMHRMTFAGVRIYVNRGDSVMLCCCTVSTMIILNITALLSLGVRPFFRSCSWRAVENRVEEERHEWTSHPHFVTWMSNIRHGNQKAVTKARISFWPRRFPKSVAVVATATAAHTKSYSNHDTGSTQNSLDGMIDLFTDAHGC